MKGWGVALIVAGVLVAALSLLMDTTVYTPAVPSYDGLGGIAAGRTYNLGRLQFQALAFVAGCTLFLAGVIFAAVGQVSARSSGTGIETIQVITHSARTVESDEERETRLTHAEAAFNRIMVAIGGALVVGIVAWAVVSASAR